MRLSLLISFAITAACRAETSEPSVVLNREERLQLPPTFEVAAASWSPSGEVLLWSSNSQHLWIQSLSRSPRSIILPTNDVLLDVRWSPDGDSILTLGRVYGRLQIFTRELDLKREAFAWERNEAGPYVVARTGSHWVGLRSGRDSTTEAVEFGEGLPMRVIATLALPRVDRDYAAEGAMQMAVIGGSDAGPVAIATKWPPFKIRVLLDQRCGDQWKRTVGVPGDSARWVAASIVNLGEQWLLTVSDLRSNHRHLIRLSQCGDVLHSSLIRQPFGAIASNPVTKTLLAVSRDSGLVYSRYTWK